MLIFVPGREPAALVLALFLPLSLFAWSKDCSLATILITSVTRASAADSGVVVLFSTPFAPVDDDPLAPAGGGEGGVTALLAVLLSLLLLCWWWWWVSTSSVSSSTSFTSS